MCLELLISELKISLSSLFFQRLVLSEIEVPVLSEIEVPVLSRVEVSRSKRPLFFNRTVMI
jgi:hypothetical protein